MPNPPLDSDRDPRPPRATAEEFEQMVRDGLSQEFKFVFRVESMAYGDVQLRTFFHESQLRPGGTISGPVLFTLADTALFALTASVLGPDPMVVTTDLNLRFLRRPKPRDLLARARLLKAGRKLLVGEVDLFSDEDERVVAHAVGSYTRVDSKPKASS